MLHCCIYHSCNNAREPFRFHVRLWVSPLYHLLKFLWDSKEPRVLLPRFVGSSRAFLASHAVERGGKNF